MMHKDVEAVVTYYTECPAMRVLARRTLSEMKAKNVEMMPYQDTWAQCLVLAFDYVEEDTTQLDALCYEIETWWRCYEHYQYQNHSERLSTVMAKLLMTHITRLHKLDDYGSTIHHYCRALAAVTSRKCNQHVFNDGIHVLLDLVGDFNNYLHWFYASSAFATLYNIVRHLNKQDVCIETGVRVTMHALQVDDNDWNDLRTNACKFLSELTKHATLCAADIEVLVKLIHTCTDRDVMEYACQVVVNIANRDDRRAMLGDTIERMLDLLVDYYDDCAFEACIAIHAVTQLDSNAKRCGESCGIETMSSFLDKMDDDVDDDPRDMFDWWRKSYGCVFDTLKKVQQSKKIG